MSSEIKKEGGWRDDRIDGEKTIFLMGLIVGFFLALGLFRLLWNIFIW